MIQSGLIYVLVDPSSGEIRYCGKTTQRWLCQRLAAHKKDAVGRRLRRHVCNWLRPIYESGREPKALICETIPFEGMDKRQQLAAINAAEQWWIAELRSMGFALTNHTDGGDGHHGFRMSEESIRKTAEANRGRKRSEQTLAKLRAAQAARDPATRRGRPTDMPLTKEHREALHAGARAYNKRPEVKAALREKLLGNSYAKRKLTDDDVRAIYRAGGTHRSIAEQYGVSHRLVGKIKSGERHASLTKEC